MLATRRTIADIAEEQGQSAWDALCELVVADDLKTGLYPRAIAATVGAGVSTIIMVATVFHTRRRSKD